MTLIGSFSLMLYLGCPFLWASISIYVLSYFHEYDPDASFDFIFLVDTFLCIALWVGYVLAIVLFQNRRWHPKLVIGLSVVASLGGCFLASYCKTVLPFLATYCLMGGLGCGMCYMVPLICGWEWYPDQKGVVTGITLGGYGLGSFIFSQVAFHLVNPDGVDATITDPGNPNITFFGPEVADRTPQMIRTIVYIWCVLGVIGFVLVSRKPYERLPSIVSERVNDDDSAATESCL